MKKYNMARSGHVWNVSHPAKASFVMPTDLRAAVRLGDSELEGFATLCA
jgi:hypothetical protein